MAVREETLAPTARNRTRTAFVPGRRRRLAVLTVLLLAALAVFTPVGRGVAHDIYALHYKLDAVPGFSGVHQHLHGDADGAAETASAAAASGVPDGQTIAAVLMREGIGPGGESVRALFAPPAYFELTNQAAMAEQYRPDQNLVFLLWEDIHSGDLPDLLTPLLRVDGGPTYTPKLVTASANAVHHRASYLVYPRQDEQGEPIVTDASRSLELILPVANAEGAQSILQWPLPISLGESVRPVAFQFTWATVLALFGGLMASMWPCLFQLTAYFIPTMAGLSMAQASARETPAVLRLRVLKTALFFVAGIVVMYTLAGAAAGAAAQSFGGTSVFETWRRPFMILSALVILYMAVRVAVKARAPLVCKMPVFGSRRFGNSYFGTMLLGIAFATGCTTCFGAAIIIAMLTYVGTMGTALYGAVTLFIFSLGIAIPLVIGALAMARVLQLLGRLERIAPWMALTSSLIMVGFAVLLLSDRFMWLSNQVGGGVLPAGVGG